MKDIKEIDKSISKDGTIRYYNEKGLLHKEDGPAYENPNGYKAWWINGKVHREDGPARIWLEDETEMYYLYNEWYSKEKWEEEVLKIKLGRIKDL